MNSSWLKFVKTFLWLVCAFHVIVGIGINVSQGVISGMAAMYGATVDLTPQFVYILKPLGAYMVVLGVLAAVAASDPLKHKAIVYAIALLFVMRALQRVLFITRIQNAFGITPARDLVNAAVFLSMGALMFVAYRQANRSA